ncbi:MAG: hypothetical protein DME07_16840 [Candidatus Rokuibacteriota bacterium]|nr:MAG: hypothetical protein DME07_16840 [Candidatus Rokubacteria bacterium]PYN56172.1 MAG: hypothetical protein DMD94_08865 [Candidatus Rokubacteria bacterium]
MGWLFDRRRPSRSTMNRDYWIVNLVDRVLEVYRRPAPDPTAPFGWRYSSRQALGPESSAMPLAAPNARVRISDLLP